MATLNERNLKELLDAFDHYFPSDTVYAADKKFKSFYGDYVWGNRKEFIDFIRRLTSVEIKNERDVANIKLAQAELVKLSGQTVEEEKSPDSNLPDEQARAQMEEERQRRQEEINKTKTDAERLVRQSIQKKLDLYKQSEKYRSALENKMVTVSPKGNLTEINLSKDDKNKLYNFAVASKDITSFQNAVRTKIQESLKISPDDVKNNIKEEVVQKSVIDLTEKLRPFADYSNSDSIPDKIFVYNSSSPIVSLADSNNEKLKEIIPNSELRDQISESAKAISIAIDSENSINFDLTKPILENDNISLLLYPKNIANFEISEKQDNQETKDNGVDISLKDIYDNGRDIYDLWGKLFNKEITIEEVFSSSTIPGLSASSSEISTVANISPLLSGLLPEVSAPILGLSSSVLARQWLLSGAPGSFAQLTASAGTLYLPSTAGIVLSSTQSLALATPSIASFTGQFMVYSSTNSIGVLAASGVMTNGAKFLAAGVKIGQSSIGIMAGGTGAKIVATGAFAKIGAALGSFAPVVGNIVGAVAGFLFGKILEKIDWGKVKKFFSNYGGPIAIGLLAGGALLGSIPMIAVGAPLLLASVPLAGGPAKFISNLAGLLGVLMTAFVFKAGKAVVITLITVPIVVAILLLIINSGAYVVPPNSGVFGNVSSPFIGITKEPSPPGPFENNELSKTITYKITITAKKSALTNVKVGYECQVISSSQLKCPSISVIPETIDSVSPANPYSFTYTSTYDSKYSDSAIIDTIRITADTTEQSGVSAETSASVTFGNPPISCPLPNGKPLNSMNYSYDSQANTGHGSTQYWTMMGSPYYRYSIPQQTSCDRPSDCSYYGYAYDVFPNGVTSVYVPTILGKSVTWRLVSTFDNPSSGHSLVYTDSTNTYTIVLTHVDSTSAPKTASSGTKVGLLFNQGGNTHLHIEFQANGRWAKPENYFCK